MYRPFLLSLFALLWLPDLSAQSSDNFRDPSFASKGKASARQEFISYNRRDLAEKNNPDDADHYLALQGAWRVNVSTVRDGGESGFHRPEYSILDWTQDRVPNLRTSNSAALRGLTPPLLPEAIPLVQYRAEIDVPYLWLDRDLYIHVEGVGGAHTLYVNGQEMGYSNDSRTPAEYLVSSVLRDGLNTIGIEVYGYSAGNWMEDGVLAFEPGTLGNVYVYSQPKLCIKDFVISPRQDSVQHNGMFWISVVMSNSYRSDERITLGYDIYEPNGGKLLTYNLKEVVIPGNDCDTLHFLEYVYPKSKKLWSPESPNLYSMMLYTRREGRITEYIPLKIGFNEVELKDDGQLWLNHQPARLNTANYNAASDAKTTEQDLKRLKSGNVNTICVDYPQPLWFYELCDKVGLYVIDQANINPGYEKDNRNAGGAVANDPRFLPDFIDRATYMQGRVKNNTSVIAISMGGESGNGYNFYKTYQHLKQLDTLRPVTYRDIQGEWNIDMNYPATGR